MPALACGGVLEDDASVRTLARTLSPGPQCDLGTDQQLSQGELLGTAAAVVAAVDPEGQDLPLAAVVLEHLQGQGERRVSRRIATSCCLDNANHSVTSGSFPEGPQSTKDHLPSPCLQAEGRRCPPKTQLIYFTF